MGRIKSIFWFIFCLFGLFGFGIIVAEVLKKWHFISQSLNVMWIIAPVLILFTSKQAFQSSYLRTRLNLSPHFVHLSTTIFNIILDVMGLLALIGLPFLWYGVIEELASQNR